MAVLAIFTFALGMSLSVRILRRSLLLLRLHQHVDVRRLFRQALLLSGIADYSGAAPRQTVFPALRGYQLSSSIPAIMATPQPASFVCTRLENALAAFSASDMNVRLVRCTQQHGVNPTVET